jgi:hypothetical protein
VLSENGNINISPQIGAVQNMNYSQVPPFQTTRERDAWGVIRGFVYQIELTVNRWLDLSEFEVLEVESGGEDIDLIKGLRGDSRLLEQVKSSDQNVTLRSEGAVSAVASFLEHRETNPKVKLYFRYVTNAAIGLERDSSLPGGLRGIEAWEMLRLKTGQFEHQELLSGIRALIKSAQQPHGLAETTFGRLQRFFAECHDLSLFDLVRSFEWSTSIDRDDGKLHLESLKTLKARGLVSSEAQAHKVYLRLFHHVIKLLTQREKKYLTLEDRNRICLLPDLPAEEQESFQSLQNILRDNMGDLCERLRSASLATKRNTEELQKNTQELERTNRLLELNLESSSRIGPVRAPRPTADAAEANRLLAESAKEYLHGCIRNSANLASKAFELDPNNSEILVRFAQSLLRFGECAKVRQLIIEHKSKPTDSMRIVHAESLWRQKEYALAIEILREIRDDHSADKHYHLGLCFLYQWRSSGRKPLVDLARAQTELEIAYERQRADGHKKFWIMVTLAIVLALRDKRDYGLEAEAALAINEIMAEFPLKGTVRIYRLLLRILAGDMPGLVTLVSDDIQQCPSTMEVPADLVETMEGRIELIVPDPTQQRKYMDVVMEWFDHFDRLTSLSVEILPVRVQ